MENDDYTSKRLENSLKRLLDFSAKNMERNKLLLEQLSTLNDRPSKLNDNNEAGLKISSDLETRVKRLEKAVFKKS